MIRSTLSLLIFLSTFASFAADSLPVRDVDFQCLDRQIADKYTQDFQIDLRSFGGLELCQANVDTKKLFNDLELIENGRFDQGSHNLIRGFVAADQYYSWMKSETRGIERGNDIPYATAYNSGGYFTMQDGWAELSTLGRVGTVIHEARHTEGYVHIRCNQGPYFQVAVMACDRDYNYGGSHAIEMEYYARVSVLGQNFHPVYKKMARLMAMGRSNFVFNTTPLQQTETLMIQGRSGRLYLLHGDQWIERETPAGATGSLKRTSFGAALWTNREAFAIDPFESSGFDWPVSDDFSYLKLLRGDRGLGATPLKDFEEFDLGRKRYVFALNEQNQYSNYNFGRGHWNTLIPSPLQISRLAVWSPSGLNGLFFVTPEGQVMQVNPESPSQIQSTSEVWPSDTKNYVRAAHRGFFQLSNSGTLYLQQAGGLQAVETPELVENVVAIPLYENFEVKP